MIKPEYWVDTPFGVSSAKPVHKFAARFYRSSRLSHWLSFLSILLFGGLAAGAVHAAAGTISGRFGVSPTGAAEYRIPITVPPGTVGMKPDLALTYSSRRGNGLLGVGWQMSGLSTITRCPATLAQDEFIDGVDLDSTDRLCLDGQRLVAVSGSYGQGGTEYRTEIETFAKVKQIGGLNTASARFKIWTKSGLILEMGHDSGAMQVPGKNAIYVWAVDRIQDTAGNYIDIQYAQASGTNEHYVKRIDYTGNMSAGLSPYNSVRFTFGTDRPDPRTAYVAGGEITASRRLTKIATYSGSQLVREYRLGGSTPFRRTGSVPLARTLTKGVTMAQRSVHVQAKKIQFRVQARSG